MTVCDPTASPAVAHVATRATTGLLTHPATLLPPSWNVTVPVGAGATGAIVAVKVTGCPQAEGSVPDVRVVVETESAWPVTLPASSDSAPAVSAAPALRTIPPLMTVRPAAQTTCSQVDSSWMRNAAAYAKQQVNSR